MTKITADIGIIAAGPAGLCAAAAAAEAGAKVVVFEKVNGAGGTANMGMGPFGVESRIQRKSMVNLKKEDVFRSFMDYTHWQVDAQLVHDYIWKSGSTIDWLEDMGVVFAAALKNFPDSEQTWHVVQPEGGGRPGARAAGSMTKAIYKYCLELGVEFYFSTPVQKLVKTGPAVTGFIARHENGETYEVECRTTIIATGGFGSNGQMIDEYCNYKLGRDMITFMVPGIVGDGIKMAWEAGAGQGRMEMERITGTPLPEASTGKWPMVGIFRQSGVLAVNKSGYRICDENAMQNSAISGNIIDLQQDRTIFKIADSNLLNFYRRNGLDFESEVQHDDPTENFEELMVQAESEAPDCVFVADTIAGLAAKLGVPADQLAATVERYNEHCANHFDDDFCKPRQYLHALKGKKFYAIRLTCGAYGSLGGIKVNHKLQVLTGDYKIIPGLYAAGSDACEIYNGTYYFYLPGNTMGFAVNTGRMAGEYAAEELS
jgi:fumarate reductase flavoprotein subunit